VTSIAPRPDADARGPLPVAAARALVKRLDALRCRLAHALVRGGHALDAAARAADALLLVGLAYEDLGLGASGAALDEAAEGNVAQARVLIAKVREFTGLSLDEAVLSTQPSRGPVQSALPHATFAELRAVPDPFGLLAQRLRSRRLESLDGAMRVAASDRQKDEGGFYTPFRLARRLAAATLGEFDAVPTVLDPACGAGTFLSAAFDLACGRLETRRLAHPSARIEPVAWTIAALHGVELDPTALLAARLALAVRAARAERALASARGQLALFGQVKTYGPMIVDRLRLGDALGAAPTDTLPGTERLKLRLLARDVPGRLPSPADAAPLRWDAAFPLRFSDDEGAWPSAPGFDRLLANPPFVPVDRIPPERRAQLQDDFRTLQKRFDLFIAFVERALALLVPGGTATLLIPRTFLTEANAERCRRLLLDEATIDRIEGLGPVAFEGARVECIALTFTRRHATEAASTELVRRGHPPVPVRQAAFRRAPRAMFRFELAEPSSEECLRLAESAVPLGRYFCASWGARGTPVGDFHLERGDHPLARPMLKGDDLQPFRLRSPTRWLLYDTDRLYRPSRREFFESPKLLIRKVSGARGLMAAVDTGGRYTDDSLACVVRKSDLATIPQAERRRHRLAIYNYELEPSRAYDLDLVCALLHTPLVQTYYRVQLGGGLNVFPELIEALPLPKVESLGRPEAVELAALGRSARTRTFEVERADQLARVLFGLADAQAATPGLVPNPETESR
jgi:hypothetical protein